MNKDIKGDLWISPWKISLRYPWAILEISWKDIRMFGYLKISQDISGYLRISLWGELPDVTFNHFVCCGCYDRGPGSRSTSTFASYKAAATHIGRSVLCQREGKGVRTVTMQYRPSGRAEDQEAGAIGAAGAWPVRPAAAAPPAGKFFHISISHTMLKQTT